MKDKRKKYRTLVLIIIILLIIHLLLLIIKIPTKTKVKEMTSIPYNDTEFYFVQETTTTERCNDIDFDWEYSWEGWKEEVNNAITPIIRIKNMDTEAGEFEVYFAFFDDLIHNYKDYEGTNYQEVRNKLPWNSATMFSNIKKFNLEPNQEQFIDIYTPKFQSNAQYWTYADIKVPFRTICQPEKSYNNITKSRSVTKYTLQNTTVEKKQKISLLLFLYNWFVN